MPIDKEIVRMHFDKHAHEYDKFARVQIDMAAKLLSLSELDELPNVLRILEIGSGTGLLTEQLLDRCPLASLTVVDISKSMLEAVRQKLGDGAERVCFVHGDAEEAAVIDELKRNEREFDLIISSATFQWFNRPEHTIAQYLELLAPGGMFAFATFGPRTFYELTESFEAAEQELKLPAVPHGSSFLAEEQWRAIFAHDSDCDLAWYRKEWVGHFPTVKHFLYSVKRIGAGNANRTESDPAQKVYTGKRLFKAMELAYLKRYSTASGIQATYDIGYGIYRKPV